MRQAMKYLAMIYLALAACLSAQPHRSAARLQPLEPASSITFDAADLGAPLRLERGWRVGIAAGSEPESPGFDDSSWSLRNATSSFPEVAEPDEANSGKQRTEDSLRRIKAPEEQRLYAWFRLHIELPPDHGPLALFVELPVSHNTSIPLGPSGPGFEVFANGRRIAPDGPHGQAPERYQPISRLYNLQIPPSETSLVLVVRTLYMPFGLGAYTNFFAGRRLLLGNPHLLGHLLANWSDRNLFERLPRLVVAILLALLAIFLLALYFGQKGHAEYLWLALHELAQAPIAFIELAGSSARLDSLWYTAAVVQLFLISSYLYFEFLVAFLGLSRRRWYLRLLRATSPALLLAGPAVLLLGHGAVSGILLLLAALMTALWLLGWILFVITRLLSAALKRNFEAALLLVPLVLSFIGSLEPVFTVGITDLTGRPYHSPLTFQAGPIPIPFAIFADFAGIFVIVLIIFFRFLRIQHEQEHASSELAAARSVQELILPKEKIATPGFEVDSTYCPASEVGGDFYYLQPTAAGLLVVIGDVAGKGLKAALNVSLLIGALRRTPTTEPAPLLAELNRVLAGSESFTTCLAAFFGNNGELTLASAGHLPPYLNSQEIALPGGLPLGALPENSYEAVHLFLHPGDRLLLLSDGVVEARRPSGELFGFDRLHNLSNQSAFYIADAARDFGQEDDITVLTVRRLAPEEQS